MGYRNAEKTKAELIVAAEVLVSNHGLAGVSAREIARHCGMKNNVAVQYHFGSIDRLYDEVVKYRMAQLEAIRSKEVTGYDIDGWELDDLIKLVCLPHLQIRDGEGRYPYAAFLCHYLPERRPEGFEWVMEAGETFTPVMQRIISIIRTKLPRLPDTIFNRRMTNATLLFLNILRGFSDRKPGHDDISHHPLIVDALRQSIAVLSTPWAGNAASDLTAPAALPQLI